jgi:hypothetical protein
MILLKGAFGYAHRNFLNIFANQNIAMKESAA